MWYSFKQNNSGGSFVANNYVDAYVWIEADSYDAANVAAEEVGIYFDGVADERNCPCCGDRWYRCGSYLEEPTKVPMLYNEKIIRRKGHVFKTLSRPTTAVVRNTVLHLYHADGTHERIFTEKGKITNVSKTVP